MVVLQISGMKEDLMERDGLSQGTITIQGCFEMISYSVQELLIAPIHTLLCCCIITVTFGHQRNSILYNSDEKKKQQLCIRNGNLFLWFQNGCG